MPLPKHVALRPPHGHAADFAGQHILIIGASGNLGRHFAAQLAAPGVRLSLWGRNRQKLADISEACRTAGAVVTIRSVDLCAIDDALAALRDEDDETPFDCAFLVSGAGDTREPGRALESAKLVTRLGLLNYVAPAALAAELGERMAGRGAGRIALVGTVAATHPLPFAAAYSSSKSGLSHFAEAMRVALKPHGVSVTLISPGFFAATTDGTHAYARPGELSVDVVAARAIMAVTQRRAELVTPWPFWLLRWIGRILPRWVRDRVLLRLPVP